MSTAASKAFKTELQYGDGATPELFLTVAELKTIEPAEAVAKTTEVTSHDSTKAEFISTYVDEGEISAGGNWTGGATQTAQVTALGGLRGNWLMCFPDWGQATQAFTAAASDICTAVGHLLKTGQPVRVSSSGAPEDLPDPLVSGTTYYVHWLDADTFTLHTTNAGAVANTGVVNITDAGTGTHTIRKGTRLSMAALVTSVKLGAPLDGAQSVDMKIKITGDTTWAT